MGNVRNNLDFQVISKFCDEHALSLQIERGRRHPKAIINDGALTWTLASSPGKPNPHVIRSRFRRACLQRKLIGG